jgi:hypothetical protein
MTPAQPTLQTQSSLNKKRMTQSTAMPTGGRLTTFPRKSDGIIIDKPSSKVGRLSAKGGRAGGNLVAGNKSTVFDDGRVSPGQMKSKGPQKYNGANNHTDPFDGARRWTPTHGKVFLTDPNRQEKTHRNCFKPTQDFDRSARQKAFVCTTGQVHAGSKKVFDKYRETLEVEQPFIDKSSNPRFASSPKAKERVERADAPVSPSRPHIAEAGTSLDFPSEGRQGLLTSRPAVAASPSRAGKRANAPVPSLEGVMRLVEKPLSKQRVMQRPYATSTPRGNSVSKAGTSFKGMEPPFQAGNVSALPKPKPQCKNRPAHAAKESRMILA